MKGPFLQLKAGLMGALSWGLMAMAFHPTAFMPLIFVGLVPWLVMIRRSGGEGFMASFLVGNTVYGAYLMAWVCTVVGWTGPVGWVLLTILWFVLSLPFAWILRALLVRWNGRLFWVLPATVVAQDVFRFWALGGVAWHSAGFALADWNTLVQMAEIGGVWVLTWLVMAANGLIADWILGFRQPSERRRLLFQTVAWIAALLGGLAFGSARIKTLDGQLRKGPTVVGLQSNIRQDMKIYSGPNGRVAMRDRHVALFRAAEAEGVRADLVVWPETSLVPGWDMSSRAKAQGRMITPAQRLSRRLRGRSESLAQVLVPLDADVRSTKSRWPRHLIGLISRDTDPDEVNEVWTRNTVAMVVPGTAAGALYEWGDVYHKRELVPFGEFLPLPQWLPGRDSLKDAILDAAGYVPDMTAGTEPVRVPLETARGKWRFDVSVCFEMLFPEIFAAARVDQVDFNVNVSNDAWYGESAELDLVHRQGIFRAVETRLSLVRVSNTGISTVLDPIGRELTTVEQDGQIKGIGGKLVAEVPVGGELLALKGGPWTLAVFYWVCFVAVSICVWVRRPGQNESFSRNLSA